MSPVVPLAQPKGGPGLVRVSRGGFLWYVFIIGGKGEGVKLMNGSGAFQNGGDFSWIAPQSTQHPQNYRKFFRALSELCD